MSDEPIEASTIYLNAASIDLYSSVRKATKDMAANVIISSITYILKKSPVSTKPIMLPVSSKKRG